MTTTEAIYHDAEGNPCDRVVATYDPFGKRMDQCLECFDEPFDSPGKVSYYIVEVDGKEMHTRLCPVHRRGWSKSVYNEPYDGSKSPLDEVYKMRLDSEFHNG